jgi:hypothetical protein
LWAGALANRRYSSADPLPNASREQRYRWIINTFDPIPFDARAARPYGALCATVQAVGRNPSRAGSTSPSQRQGWGSEFRSLPATKSTSSVFMTA